MIIAEVGKNHHGSEKYANEYLKKSIISGVDAVLYHIREKEFYHKTENKKKSLSDSFYKNAIIFANKKKKKIGITLADVEKIDFLEDIGIDFYKILSQDINNKKLIKKILKTNKPTYISTGLSNFTEISKLVQFIKPNIKNVTLIHTTLRSDIEHVNFNAIPKLSKKFHLPVAFGNHCNNPLVLFTSIAYKPSDIFFYVKGSKFKNHQDDIHAIKLKDLQWYVKNLKELEFSLGTETKMKLSIPL
jgi:sialic acid synthase SpsE